MGGMRTCDARGVKTWTPAVEGDAGRAPTHCAASDRKWLRAHARVKPSSISRRHCRGWLSFCGLEQNIVWAVQTARYASLATIDPMSEDPFVKLPLIAARYNRMVPTKKHDDHVAATPRNEKQSAK
jgi:hypothetical protein